ncbi:pyridoxamine 5'-phosphate oxidase family protein [Mumia qirimensis]|uniref:pyridoxamine 5'-phosphate oxidase family protein n=1 Tax=Mumia qirimensis TaxID=3234852 RepID=UPI00351D6837
MDREQLVEYVRARRDGVVTSVGPDGAPQAAYVELTATGRGEIVFDARAASRKIANLREDARVAIVIGGSDGTTLQCEGEADIPDGRDRERCAAAYVADLPQYEASLTEPGIVLVRVRLSWVRLADHRSEVAVIDELTFGSPEIDLSGANATRG